MPTAKDKVFRFIAKFLAVFFASLFALATILVIIFFNVENTLLNAGTYKRALVKNNVYGQLPALAMGETEGIETLLADPAGTGRENWNFMNDLTSADWQRLLNLVLPPDEAKSTVENMMDQVFASINGESDSAHLSLVVLKANLTGQAGKEAIQYLLNIQPPCTEDQVGQIHSENPAVPEQPVYCRPAEQELALLTSQWQEQVDSTIAGIPDEFVIIKPASERTDKAAPGIDPIARLNTVRLIIRFSPLLSLILLVLITLLMVRSLKTWLLWWGIPLFITGLIATAIGLAIPSLLNLVWVNTILPQFPSVLSTGMRGLTRNLVSSVAQALATPITLEAAIIGLLGLVTIIGSSFVEAKRKEGVSLAPRGPE